MTLPPIVVDVAQAEQKPAMAEALLDACSRAASPTQCVTPNQADEEEAFAVAIVVWLDNGDAVRVQVGLRQGERRGEWLSRRVQFDASDDETERWTATGFVVGTLAGRFVEESGEEADEPARELAPPEESPVTVPPAPEPREEVPADDEPSVPRVPPELSLNLGGLARPQFAAGPWGVGGVLQGHYEPRGWPVFVHAGLHGSYRRRDRYGILAYFGDADLGLGVRIARFSQDWDLSSTWSLGLQRMQVEVKHPTSGLRDRAQRWLGGARVTFEVDWMPSSRLGAFASLGAVWWWASTDIEVEDQVVEEQPALLGEVALGLKFGIF